MRDRERVLFFFPHDLGELRSGAHRYAYEIVRALKNLGAEIDLLSFSNWKSAWENPERLSHLFGKTFLFDYGHIARFRDLIRHPFRYKGLRAFLLRLARRARVQFSAGPLVRGVKHETIPRLVSPEFVQYFSATVQKGDYSQVFINYCYWSDLAELVPSTVPVTLVSHDFLTVQADLKKSPLGVGRYLENELQRIDQFDNVLVISHEELVFFRTFSRKPRYFHLPMTLSSHATSPSPPEYDLIYVGSENSHNVAGLRWYLDHCHSQVRAKGFRVLIAGRICEKFAEYGDAGDSLSWAGMVDDVENLYRMSRVALCPVLSGSGMKIKVVEALSFGLPVVTNSHGVAGFLNKAANGCLVADEPADFVEAILSLLEDEAEYLRIQTLGSETFQTQFASKIGEDVLKLVISGVRS